MPEMYILADGREFPENTHLPRIERHCLAADIARLRSFGRDQEGRRREFDRIHRSMGNAYAERLRVAYDEDRERRKAARGQA